MMNLQESIDRSGIRRISVLHKIHAFFHTVLSKKTDPAKIIMLLQQMDVRSPNDKDWFWGKDNREDLADIHEHQLSYNTVIWMLITQQDHIQKIRALLKKELTRDFAAMFIKIRIGEESLEITISKERTRQLLNNFLCSEPNSTWVNAQAQKEVATSYS